MRQVFVLPDDRRSPSGGNVYNRRLLAALREAGVALSVMTFEAAVRDARQGRPARYWVDSLLLDRMAGFQAMLRRPSECFAIVHYFPSLQPGASSRVRARWRRIEDAAFGGADGFLLTSAFSAREIASRGAGAKPTIVVPPAPSLRSDLRKQRRRPGFSALMVANVTAGKGVLDLLRGLRERLSPAAPFSLRIAGRTDLEPDYLARCRRVIERAAALRGKVRFMGSLGPQALRRAYEDNAFFISASGMETFGMALQEARLFGLYVLALEGGNAAMHVASANDGEIAPSIDELSGRVALLAADAGLRERVLARVKASGLATTWTQAAAAFLEQMPMPQRRIARNIRPPRRLRAAATRPAPSSRLSAVAQAAGISPRGMKVQ